MVRLSVLVLRLSAFALMSAVAGVAYAGNGFWTPDGPSSATTGGGFVATLVIAPGPPGKPSTLYAGFEGGVFWTSDESTWSGCTIQPRINNET
jgi:hypothetical protein